MEQGEQEGQDSSEGEEVHRDAVKLPEAQEGGGVGFRAEGQGPDALDGRSDSEFGSERGKGKNEGKSHQKFAPPHPPGQKRQRGTRCHAVEVETAQHWADDLSGELGAGQRLEGGGRDYHTEEQQCADPAAEKAPEPRHHESVCDSAHGASLPEGRRNVKGRRAVMGLRRVISERLAELLTQPLSSYERRGWNDVDALRRHIRKGDVLLVEGDTRIAAVIKYLTQSSWSHSVLYVGDELIRHPGPVRERALAEFGDHAQHLLVEALPEGVVAAPLNKYVDMNLRVCRPFHLRPEHLQIILDDAIAAIGWRYDLLNVLDLARYFLPVSLVPARFRRDVLHFGSKLPTEVICSSLLGRLFEKVGYPIMPIEGMDPLVGSAPASQSRIGWFRRLLGQESPEEFTGLFRMRHPTLLTPRDFDLSPYFEIVKFNVLVEGHFDYQKIHWEVREAIEAKRSG